MNSLFSYIAVQASLVSVFVCLVKKIRKTVLKQSLIHWNSAKPKNMVSSRRTCISGTTAGAASGNGACSIGGSIKQPVSVELGASNHPVCVTIASEGRRAKMLASEKIALRRELYKIPARPKVKKKEVRSKSQPCHLRSLGKKFHSCSGVSGNVSGTTMKISLTPCVPTNSARNDHKNGNPVSNSCPPTQKVKSIEQEMKCRKKLKFLRDDTTPMTSSTLSSPITITSSPSPPPSSPSLQETIWIASSPESTPDINSSGDTDTSAIIDIEGDTSSDTCNESKPLFIRNFSICIAPIKI